MIKRREFIAGLGAAAWPLAARGQQRPLVIGFLSAADADFNTPFLAALKQGLADGGYEQDRNVEILFRYAEYRFNRLPISARTPHVGYSRPCRSHTHASQSAAAHLHQKCWRGLAR